MVEESVTSLTLFVRYEENQFREVSKVALTDEAALANDERRLCFFFVDVGVAVAFEVFPVFKGSNPVGEDLRTTEEVGVGHGHESELLLVAAPDPAATVASSWICLYCSPSPSCCSRSPSVTTPSSINRL